MVISLSGSSAGGVLEIIGLPEQMRGATLVMEMGTGYSNLLYVDSDLITAHHAPLFCHALCHHIQMCEVPFGVARCQALPTAQCALWCPTC